MLEASARTFNRSFRRRVDPPHVLMCLSTPGFLFKSKHTFHLLGLSTDYSDEKLGVGLVSYLIRVVRILWRIDSGAKRPVFLVPLRQPCSLPIWSFPIENLCSCLWAFFSVLSQGRLTNE